MSDPEPAPFVRVGPQRPASAVVISVPHAGRDYRPELLRSSRLSRHMLETLEDRLVDQLVWRATAAGAGAFIARAPRAEIDLNRDEREIDPITVAPPLPSSSVVQSARSRGGIGLVPSRISGIGPIWAERISRTELTRRIETIHRPYHRALESALAETRARFGAAVLLDCHSMPARGPDQGPAIIFGDRHGTSCGADLVDAAMSAATSRGFKTASNHTYAGGYIAQRHGRPSEGIHALQIEIDRSLYLGPDLRSPGPGFASVCDLIAAIVEALDARLLDLPIAAE